MPNVFQKQLIEVDDGFAHIYRTHASREPEDSIPVSSLVGMSAKVEFIIALSKTDWFRLAHLRRFISLVDGGML